MRPLILYNGNHCTGKTTCLHWDRPLMSLAVSFAQRAILEAIFVSLSLCVPRHLALCYSLDTITSTQVEADRGALRIWRWVSFPEGGQKFWLQWQLADTAWLACAHRSGHTICCGAAKQRTSTIPLSSAKPHLNSIFASKLHAEDPLYWVICIRLIRWHGAHLQAVVIVMEILLPDPEKLPSSLWSRNLRVLPKLMSGYVIAYAGDSNFYHNILCFFAGVSNSIQIKN